MRIAALLTTFNRKQKTLACLKSLRRQKLPAGVEVDIHLTDDASADGTADAVRYYFPEAMVYDGTGNLFWAGGMRNSWSEARKGNYDYYFLLNDDTLLRDDALAVLLSCPQSSGPTVCVGTTADNDGKFTYGGRAVTSRVNMRSQLVFSETDYLDCDLGNANIMLVPSEVVQTIGILASDFTHGIADYDYTLKARKAGFGVKVAPGVLGTCVHDHGNNWKSSKAPLRERINYLKSPKGLAYGEYLGFIRNHFPLYYPSAFCKLWAKTLCPFIWEKFKR
jgi:GT2 family glycosyltransferase